MDIIKQDIATQSGHWYAKDGSCAYEVIGKNGKRRNTTLRDAKKLGLYPSVTGIIRCAAAPGLENWKLKNMLLAALTLPRHDDESLDQYAERVIKDANEQSNSARDLGTEIHGAIEKFFEGYYDGIHLQTCEAVDKALYDHFGVRDWKSEKSFANALGFGGKVDLHSTDIVADFKTKAFTKDKLPEAYDEHSLQLAAYRAGLGIPEARGSIVFVSTAEPGLIHIVDISEEEMKRGWDMFKSLLSYWQFKNKYVPNQ